MKLLRFIGYHCFTSLFVLLFSFQQLFAQIEADTFYIAPFPVPELYTSNMAPALPANALNHKLGYFPPTAVWQMGASCGEASGVYNCLSYEFNRLRNTVADSGSILSPAFSYHFLHEGYGWYGVSTFDAWNLIKSQGNPVLNDFEEYMPFQGDENAKIGNWMNGYNRYYRSMKNRIKNYYSLSVKTDNDLKILQHYLHDHLDGSESGGTAIFYSNNHFYYTAGVGRIYDETVASPYVNRYIFDDLSGTPGHSMTLAGYYTNTEVDFNGDGLINDDIDINNDGVVDMYDNEKTLWVIVNSYGEEQKAVFFVRYHVPVQFWNSQVFIPVPDTGYAPLLTFKIRMKHSCRNHIKIRAGIAYDIAAEEPERYLDLPVFNFAGGVLGMLGIDSLPESDTLEFGIDVSDLLLHTENASRVKIFMTIENAGHIAGELREFGILHYNNQIPTQYKVVAQSEEIAMHSANSYAAIVNISAVGTDTLLRIENPGSLAVLQHEGFAYNLSTTGGTPPYSYQLVCNAEYTQELSNEAYSETGMPILLQRAQRYMVPGWAFPFAGELFDSVGVAGYAALQFHNTAFTFDEDYPYQSTMNPMGKENTLEIFNGFRYTRGAMAASGFTHSDSSMVVWFRKNGAGAFKARVELFVDGRIKVSYKLYLTGYDWYRSAGIRTRNNVYYCQLPPLYPNEELPTVIYHPQTCASLFSIDNEGVLRLDSTAPCGIHEVYVAVYDSTGNRATKRIAVEVIEKETEAPVLYPNPTSDHCRIYIQTLDTGTAVIEFFDRNGKKAAEIQQYFRSGSNQIEFSTQQLGLDAGLYLCRYRFGNQTAVTKLVVQ